MNVTVRMTNRTIGFSPRSDAPHTGHCSGEIIPVTFFCRSGRPARETRTRAAEVGAYDRAARLATRCGGPAHRRGPEARAFAGRLSSANGSPGEGLERRSY